MHSKGNYDEALKGFKEILGNERIVLGKELECYKKNEIGASREIPFVLKPIDIEEVVRIVKTAGRHKIPLYPVSTGNNWGYGAALPVKDACVIVDLSLMRKILSFDKDLGVVTVEPGVTPAMLRDHLDKEGASYLVPVSGAGPDCSLIGNALERGYGVTPFVDHFSAVLWIEAVLADGSVYRPALSEMGAQEVDSCFKWGIGPYIDGIFSQGSFGIVTRMSIALAPISKKTTAFLFGLKDDSRLEEAVLAIRDVLKKAGNIMGSVNLMNDRRVLAMVEEYPSREIEDGSVMQDRLVERLSKRNYLGAWTVGGIIYGDPSLTAYAKKIIRKRTRGIAKRLMFFTRKRIDLLKGILNILPKGIFENLKKQLRNLDESFKVAEGSPTEIALPLCYWKSGTKPDKGVKMNPARDGCGVIWYSPLVPMKPEKVRVYTGIVKKTCTKHGIEPLITLTSLSHRTFDSTVPLLFDPMDPDEVKRARDCYQELFDTCKKEGFVPYRLGIDHMDLAINSSTYWKAVLSIKKCLDPDNIISPGRYCPGERSSHKN